MSKDGLENKNLEKIDKKPQRELRFFVGGVHAFSAKFVGVLQGLFDDFHFGDFEACGSGVFDVKTSTKWDMDWRVK